MTCENSIAVVSQQIADRESKSPPIAFRQAIGPSQRWLAGVSHHCGAARRAAGAVPLWSSMRAAIGPESQGQPRADSTSNPAASSKSLGAANPGRGRTGRGFEKRRPKGHTPRHNALHPMPVIMSRPVASHPVPSGARSRGCPRSRRSRDRGIFDHGSLPRCLDALRLRGALHTR